MLTEIIHLRRICAITQQIEITPTLIADWKEAIIRDTLYGVDIKPEAIEVAQLRLWLALIVDQTLEQARPLPNLDYKLMAGNSLIETIDGEPVLEYTAETLIDSTDGKDADGVPILPYQTNMLGDAVQVKMDLFATEKAIADERIKLDQLRKAFFRAKPDERKRIREQVNRQERQIMYASLEEKEDRIFAQIQFLSAKSREPKGMSKSENTKLHKLNSEMGRINALQGDVANPDKSLPFFLYQMHFHEVFARKGGFDVVIANPPYVRQEQITVQKPELQAAYPEVYAGTADLYVYFYARGLRLARPNGTLIYITPNKFLRAGYGKHLRDHLRSTVTIDALTDFGDLPLFDATTYPLIVALKKTAPVPDHAIRTLTVTDMAAVSQIAKTSRNAFALPQRALTDSEWQLSDPIARALMDKLRAAGKPLGEYVNGKIYYGIKTGFNEAFVIDGAKRAELIAADPKSAEVIKPFLRGRDVKRWRVEPQDLYLIFTRRGIKIENYPAVLAHLAQFKDRLMPGAKGGRKAGSYEWYEIQDNVAYYPEFEKPKIISARFMVNPLFGWDNTSSYVNDACYVISGDIFVYALLMSRVGWHFLSSISSLMQNSYFQIHIQTLEQIPIPHAHDALRTKIGVLAEQCLAAAKDHPDRLAGLESQLNKWVYEAYGLTEAEIRIVERTASNQTEVSGSLSGIVTSDIDE